MGHTYTQEYKVKVIRDAATDKIVREFWYDQQGALNRDGNLPALIGYDPETGNITEAAWYTNGLKHRDGAPAHLRYDTNTKIVTQEAWYLRGELHKDNSEPALISRDAITGKVIEIEFWQYGKKISEQSIIPDGPT